jgi:hypothetical protein
MMRTRIAGLVLLATSLVCACDVVSLDGILGDGDDAGEPEPEPDDDAGTPPRPEPDTTPPVVTFVDPADPCIDGTVTFTFMVTDDRAGVGIVSARFAGLPLTLTDDGAGLYSGSRDVTSLSEAIHLLVVTAIDTENNIVDAERAFGVSHGGYVPAAAFTCGTPPDGGAPDVSPPDVSILTPTANALVGDSVDLAVEVLDESPPLVVTAHVGGAPVTLTGFNVFTGTVPTVSLPEGPATITVVAEDALGHSSSKTRGIRVDHTPPTLTIVDPLPGATKVALTDVVVETTDENAISRVVLYRQGVAAPLAIAVEPLPGNPARYGLFYQLPCAGLPAQVTFVVESSDVALNIASASVTVQVTPEGCGS